MATQRIESGQIQLRGAGAVPLVQAQPQQVDYIGLRMAAQGDSQLAQILDRMSAGLFKTAAEMRSDEGLQYVVDRPPTTEQLNAAKNGDPTSLIPSGNFSYFDKAVKKARSFELASEFNIEMSNIANNIALEAQQGLITAEQARDKLNNAQAGMSKSLAQIDPEATLKFRATSAMHGNTIVNEVYKVQLQKEKAKKTIKLDQFFDTQISHLQMTIDQGFWVDANGKQRSIEEKVEVIRAGISDAAISIGDIGIQKEYSEKFKVELRNAKINSVTKSLLDAENMEDPDLTLKKIPLGDVGRMSFVLKDLIVNDFDAVAKITANFMTAVNYRKSTNDAKAAEDKKQGEIKAINLLEQIFPLPDSPRRRDLVKQLLILPEGSVPLSLLKDLLEPKPPKEAESNQTVNFNLIAGIYNDTITRPEQIWAMVGSKGITGKDAVIALKLLESEDRRESSELDRGISQLAGIPVIPGSVVVIDPKGEEFKRRNELKAQALQIQAVAAAEGKTLTPRQILTQLEDNIAKTRNTETAKAARKSLEVYEKLEWINGPINNNTLPALERKAGDDRKKLQELKRIKELLRQANGEQ